jgi:hypothetical protein
MAKRTDAEEALYDAVIACVENAAKEGDADLLKAAAEAFGSVAHGPSGGHYIHNRTARDESRQESRQTYRGETTYDYHETHHPDGDPKPKVGFGEEP